MVDPKKFLINTDYPLDKVVYMKSGSFSISGVGDTTTNISHGLSFIPLVCGQWSFNSNFSTCYEFYSGTIPSQNPALLFDVTVEIIATSSQITLTTRKSSSGSATVYYRIFAFQPSDSNVSISNLASSSNDLVLSSDYNYLKLSTSNYFTMGTDTSKTITHSLGYRPRVLAWAYWNTLGYMFPITLWSDSSGTIVGLRVTTSSLVFTNPNGYSIGKVYYRIYLDE